jgi:hypothetical protein
MTDATDPSPEGFGPQGEKTARPPPGPYRVIGWSQIYDVRGCPIATAQYLGETDEHTTATAHLLAASWELAEVLEVVEGAISTLDEDVFGYTARENGKSRWAIRDELLAKIRAILAKARPSGGQS